MANHDPRIYAYIAKAQPFARPILERIRRAVHTACPDVTETIKWSMPAFEYKGPLVGMAAFKAHCALKTDATRDKRLETAVQWMSEGKIRNWKYVR
jgi:uncharacterized protein YdhG (YjbR/CyaY superfamily)